MQEKYEIDWICEVGIDFQYLVVKKLDTKYWENVENILLKIKLVYDIIKAIQNIN